MYIYLLNEKNLIIFKTQLFYNLVKIIFSSILMLFFLYFSLEFFAENLDFNNHYKSIYILLIVCFVSTIYLISCFLFGILRFKNYKFN